jgi:hypothetical protein
VEIDWQPRCDDETLPADPQHPVRLWWQATKSASERAGKPIEYPSRLTAMLERIGFEVERDETIRMESWIDYARNEQASRVQGAYCNVVGRSRLQERRVTNSFGVHSALAMAHLTRQGWRRKDVEELQEGIYESISDSRVHLYQRL